MGWRYLLFTLGAVTLFVFFLRFFVFHFRESPKFLIYRGQDAQAIDLLHHMAKINRTECALTLQTLTALETESDSVESGGSSDPMIEQGMARIKKTWRESFGLDLSRWAMLFDGFQMTRLTILTWLTYIMDFWGFTVAGKSPIPSS
jgi:hypothetical protein